MAKTAPCGVCRHEWSRHEEYNNDTLVCLECPSEPSAFGMVARVCARL